MKFKLTPEDYAKLEATAQANYVLKNGSYVLNLEDVDVDEITASAARLTAEHKAAADKLAAERAKAATEKQTLESRVSQLTESQQKLQNNLVRRQLEGETSRAFLEKGGMADALPYVLAEISEKFKVTETGDLRLFVDGVATETTVDKYIADVVSKKSFFFKPPTGAGATGSGSGSAVSGVVNPWKKESKNYTEQARLLKESPDVAAQLKSEAGVK